MNLAASGFEAAEKERCKTCPPFSERIDHFSISELVTSPKRPVVQITPWLRLFQKAARVEDSVVALEPEMTSRLPADLGAGSISNKSGAAALRSSD